jgi:hypothetical protein
MSLKSGYFLAIVYFFTVALYGGILILQTSRPSKLRITIILGLYFVHRRYYLSKEGRERSLVIKGSVVDP